ncbi:TPA: restriction endonuclease subunit S [Morganella morganii]
MSNFIFSVPDVWVLSELPLVAEINMGQSPSSADVNELGEGIVFFQGKAEFGKLYPIPKKYCTKPAKVASEGSILLSVRAPVGPTNIAKQLTAIGRGLAAISARREITNGKYLLYYFRCIEPWLSNQGTGTTFKAISGQFIKELAIPLPPLAEQKIIADKLDDLLARVESIKTRLDNIPKILKKFRQSVLVSAFQGEVTKEWRSKHAEIKKISLKDIGEYWSEFNKESRVKKAKLNLHVSDDIGNLPDTWLDTKIGFVFDVHVGATPSRNIKEYWNGDIPWVSSSEVEFSRIVETKEKITDLGLDKTSTNIHPVGTVMLAMIGQGKTRGQTAILDIEACHNQNTAALRVPSGFAVPEFLYLFLEKQYEKTRRVGGGNNQQALNKSFVQSLAFPLPPFEEQIEIVETLNKLFHHTDIIQKQIDNALSQINSLTQSILAKAFRGELTAQWREENFELISGLNSAEALLEKITAEKLAAGTIKKRAKKTSH